MEKMKVKGAQAQRLKAQVCVVASQLRAPRGEQESGAAPAGTDLGASASALGCFVSWDAQHKCCLRSRAYVHKKNKKHPTNLKMISTHLISLSLCSAGD